MVCVCVCCMWHAFVQIYLHAICMCVALHYSLCEHPLCDWPGDEDVQILKVVTFTLWSPTLQGK